jgi:hypothetical protein
MHNYGMFTTKGNKAVHDIVMGSSSVLEALIRRQTLGEKRGTEEALDPSVQDAMLEQLQKRLGVQAGLVEDVSAEYFSLASKYVVKLTRVSTNVS